jgi:UPF0755 protein
MTPTPPANSRHYYRIIFALVLSGFLLAGSAAVFLWRLNRPTRLEEVREIYIQPGMSARRIGQLLEKEGLIRSARLFASLVRLQGVERRLEAGTYRFDGAEATADLIQQLLQAPLQLRRITLREGLTRQETAALLAHHELADSARFMALTENPALIRRLRIDAPTLEGYLFPDTYFFGEASSETTIVEALVNSFHQVFADSLDVRLDAIGLSLHEAVTLASIVEREARRQEERPLISGVFLRRLRLNRRLESCATIHYALGFYKADLTYQDLRIDSPYNTYRHPGLPPGPIANPGRAAILATLYPAETEYLYFVSRGDGTHIFSRTNQEHERAKRSLRR